MKKLPIGIQTINEIIEQNYIYVDKTEYIYNLLENKYYFLSRPRRFGKSLLISTMKEILSGNKELFKNCWIYDKIEWETHPVIHIDFSAITHSKSLDDFENNIKLLLGDIGLKYGVKLELDNPKEKFLELAEKLAEKHGKVVVLVDEYDKPIVDYIDNHKKANENKAFLAEFYETLKFMDKYLKLVFITGVTKFSKDSIFSKLNNLVDITLISRFNNICGYTQKELENNFTEYLSYLESYEKIKRHELLNKIKIWYNGYSWDGENTLYNPFGILNLFYANKFHNFWFQTATPTFLIKLIKDQKVLVEEFEGYKSGETIFESYDIENLHPVSILFQTGYLTIKKYNNRRYTFGYPNFEVKESFLVHLLASFSTKRAPDIEPIYLDMVDFLKAAEIDKFKKALVSVMSAVPSVLHLKYESYYQSMVYIVLSLLGASVKLEDNTDKGRIDGVIEFDNLIYIIEFKMDKAESALKQIEDKKYYEKYLDHKKTIILMGVGGFREKNITIIHKKLTDS